ncbi:MAG: hypothetical protein ACLRXG_10290 [Oscillospiraceae bacterium]
MKLNGNTSKRSAAARREAADFAAQERSAHRSTANRSTQSEAAARRAAAPKQAAAQRPPVPRQEQPARRGAPDVRQQPAPKEKNRAAAATGSPCASCSSCWPSSWRRAPSAWCSWRKRAPFSRTSLSAARTSAA